MGCVVRPFSSEPRRWRDDGAGAPDVRADDRCVDDGVVVGDESLELSSLSPSLCSNEEDADDAPPPIDFDFDFDAVVVVVVIVESSSSSSSAS